MYKYINIILWYLTQGAQKQSYLGARWILEILKVTPKALKRKIALIILSMSPHYFFRYADSSYDKMSYFKYLESEFIRNKLSRKELFDNVLKQDVDNSKIVMDYGCGAGFMASAAAPYVEKLFAIDVSLGVLGCASILNGSSNISYLHTANIQCIANESVDLVYSFAVIQHVDEITFQEILGNIMAKLKVGGKVIIHIVFAEPGWRSESEWKMDKTIHGKLKLNFGLYCFARKSEVVIDMFRSVGFDDVKFSRLDHRYREIAGDLAKQHIFFTTKKVNASNEMLSEKNEEI
jgi:SAM-dependent methyltransferase